MIRIAVIGCGTVTERLHLPAIASLPEMTATWIVDVALDRARTLARKYGVPQVTHDYTQVADVDAALIATPHHLHAPMGEFFLRQGVHVLCEKPLAINAEHAERLVTIARNKDLILTVGVFRRYYPVSAFFRHAIEVEWLGPIERIDVEEGDPYSWKSQSTFMMDCEKAGGGVLIDTGSHTLDRLLWWFGSPEVLLESYYDNSYSGVETDCEMRLSMPWRGRQIPVRVELSRTRTLRNTFQVFMSHGMIESPVNDPTKAWFLDQRLNSPTSKAAPVSINLSSPAESLGADIASYFKHQLSDFCAAIMTGKEPLNVGKTVVVVVRLIESCYATRQAMSEPWVHSGMVNTEGSRA